MVSTDQARASSVAHNTIALSSIRLLIHEVVFVVVVVMHITYATVLFLTWMRPTAIGIRISCEVLYTFHYFDCLAKNSRDD